MSEQPYDADAWWAKQKHQYTPAKVSGTCLHRMEDGVICGSSEPDAYLHQPPYAREFQ